MHMPQLAALIFALSGVLAVAPTVGSAGEVFASVKSRGLLRCGVSEGIPDFSQRDATGRWQLVPDRSNHAVALAKRANMA